MQGAPFPAPLARTSSLISRAAPANLAQHQQNLASAQAQQQRDSQQQTSAPPPGGSDAQHLVVTLQHRVASIEAILKRPDVQGEHRAKAQAELKASQAQLQNVVKSFLAHHPQATGGGGGNSAAADLQQAQRVAMAQRELEIQRRASGANGVNPPQQMNAAYRTGSPANFPLQNPQLRDRKSVV